LPEIGSRHWARELSRLGTDVRRVPAMFVKAYVKRGKSDAIDAEAICEAVTRALRCALLHPWR
jgi:transposase